METQIRIYKTNSGLIVTNKYNESFKYSRTYYSQVDGEYKTVKGTPSISQVRREAIDLGLIVKDSSFSRKAIWRFGKTEMFNEVRDSMVNETLKTENEFIKSINIKYDNRVNQGIIKSHVNSLINGITQLHKNKKIVEII